MKKLLAVIALTISLFVTGCATTKQIEVQTIEVAKTPLNIPDPAPLSIDKSIQWRIITEQNSERVFGDLEKANLDPVLFGLSDEGYQKLAENFEGIRAYIVKLRNVLKQYRDYYEGSEDDDPDRSEP